MNYIKVSIRPHTKESADICIAQLSELGFEGFEETEDLLEAFIPEPRFDEKQMHGAIAGYSDSYTKLLIPPRNWNEEWEKDFQPVCIGDFCGIRAFFHQPIPSVSHEIIITPKMSFGTGHHPTTALMMEAMSRIGFKEKSVLDFGTGTGILSILAEKLGAGSVLAVDLDDWSIENARENTHENHCRNIQIEKIDRIPLTRTFDIILANINKTVILANLDLMGQQLGIGGVLLLSGLLEPDATACIQRAKNSGFVLERQLFREGWGCLDLRKTNLQKQLTLE